jgi:hypothetical protein
MKTILLILFLFVGSLCIAQVDSAITINFQEDFLVEGFNYTSAKCKVEVNGSLYSIWLTLLGPDSVDAGNIVKETVQYQYTNLSGAEALDVLDVIYNAIEGKADILVNRYNRVATLKTRYQKQYLDLQTIRNSFGTLKTWAQSQ